MQAKDEPQKHIFTYAEAVRLLPQVRSLTEQAFLEVEGLRAALGKKRLDAEPAQEQANQAVRRWTEALAQHGLVVKGLWLVDFDNGSGYYCWRYPEDGLQYYHSYEEGFPGRMRIQ